ncbi:hypothetical protein M5E87_13955 [Flavonifractor plautii]|nr:hypothetical protein M5E87_13955 [Flavonifractor plautii]
MTGRVVVLFLLYLVSTLFTTLTIFLIPVFQGFVLYCLCRWTIQWKRVREGTGRIVGATRTSRSTPTKCTVTWPGTPGSSTIWAPPSEMPWTSASRASASRPS